MKYIVLSFDDSRSDTYKKAFKIMNNYSLKATVNVISDFVSNPNRYSFPSSPEAMTVDELMEWKNNGYEIACHGKTHQNTKSDVLANIEDLKRMNLLEDRVGFASPNSWITEDNLEDSGIDTLMKERIISYVRTGIQVRREGIVYVLLSVVERITRSKHLYRALNKKNIISSNMVSALLPSVAIKNHNSVKQLKYIIEKMNDGDGLIIMFHSILNRNDDAYKKDSYYWDEDKFKLLCEFLMNSKNVCVVTTMQLVDLFMESKQNV